MELNENDLGSIKQPGCQYTNEQLFWKFKKICEEFGISNNEKNRQKFNRENWRYMLVALGYNHSNNEIISPADGLEYLENELLNKNDNNRERRLMCQRTVTAIHSVFGRQDRQNSRKAFYKLDRYMHDEKARTIKGERNCNANNKQRYYKYGKDEDGNDLPGIKRHNTVKIQFLTKKIESDNKRNDLEHEDYKNKKIKNNDNGPDNGDGKGGLLPIFNSNSLEKDKIATIE